MVEHVLEFLVETSWINEVLYEVKSGKEATVFCCRAHPRTGEHLVAVKVYRSQIHRTFSNDAAYRDGEYIPNRRLRCALQRKTRFGREVQYETWISREWEAMQALHAAGADIPRPVHGMPGAVIMEYLGDEEGPAPRLAESRIEAAEAATHLDAMLGQVRLWLAANHVHGDLSAYNILHWQGRLRAIDFPQACDPRLNANAEAFLHRDIANLARAFERHGVSFDAEAHAASLWREFQTGELRPAGRRQR